MTYRPSFGRKTVRLPEYTESRLDILSMRETKLVGRLPDPCLFLCRDLIVGGRHGKQAIEQLAAFAV